MRQYLENSCGSSVVEFALIAPMLVLGVLSIADIGFEISDRMEIDHGMRNGAEAALKDPGVTVLNDILTGSQAISDGENAIAWDVQRACVCPEADTVSVDCFTTCSNDQPTAIFYRIEGSKDAVRIFLPDLTVSRTLSVQVR